jgi:hypothetical protein
VVEPEIYDDLRSGEDRSTLDLGARFDGLMSEVLTHEIDLRPFWLQRVAKKNAAERSRSALFVACGVGALVIVMFAFGKDPAPAEKRAAVVPVLDQLDIEKPAAPIVIHATREEDVEVAVDPAPVAGVGRLKLESDPRVVVFAGARRLGRTPLEVMLPAGTHELRFVDKARHLEVKRRVDVRANGRHSRELNFGIGALRVRAPEGTKLWLNKKYVGTAPFRRIELAEGRHRLKLKRGVEVVEEWLVVPPSQTVDYRVNFSE